MRPSRSRREVASTLTLHTLSAEPRHPRGTRYSRYAPWHFLYFFPEPQGHGSFRPTLAAGATGAFGAGADVVLAALVATTLGRGASCCTTLTRKIDRPMLTRMSPWNSS